MSTSQALANPLNSSLQESRSISQDNNAHRNRNAPERPRSNRRNAEASTEPRNRQSRSTSANRPVNRACETSTPPAATVAGNLAEGATPGGRAPAGRTPSSGNTAKRTAANHLLNFQFQPPPSSARVGGGAGRGGSREAGNRRRPGTTSRPQKYDRNKFLQANYRFLVSDGVEEQVYHADADKMFDWEDVLQVELLSSAPVQCPISLDCPPVCPQITPCGHIYSFPAIMQHLVFHGGERLSRWAPCPLCFEPVVARDLRLVRITPVTTPKIGSELTFQLLRRGRTSIMPKSVGLPPASPPTTPTDAAAAGGRGNSSNSNNTTSGQPNASPATGGAAPGPSDGKAVTLQPPAAAAVQQDLVNPLAANKFVKFAVLGSQEAVAIWQQVAEQLATYAAEVTAEGGLDAATVAPFVFMSLDSLAIRARKWSQRRSQLLLDRTTPEAMVVGGAGAGNKALPGGAGPGVEGIDPQADGQAAEAAVKQMFVAAVKSVTHHVDEAGCTIQDVVPEFPSLPTAKPSDRSRQQQQQQPASSAVPPQAAATITTTDSPRDEDDVFAFPEAAFSDVDECDLNEGQQGVGNGSGSQVEAAGVGGGAGAGDEVDDGGGSGTHQQDSPPPDTLLGSSPTTLALSRNASGDYHMYQSIDGQWTFLDPLCVRALVSHYGSFEQCPATVTAQLVDLERIEQNEATRKRWKFVSHLPLTGAFHLAEVNLTKLLPATALQPFAEELKAREKRRRRRIAQEQRTAAAEAAATRQAARRGPSESELAAMPALGAPGSSPMAAAALAAGPGPTLADAEALAAARELGFATAEELAESMALQASLDATTLGSSPTPHGVSFARIAKMGFAATGPTLGSGSTSKAGGSASGPGPGLGSSPPPGAPSTGYTPPALQGAWAKPAASNKPAGSRGASSAAAAAPGVGGGSTSGVQGVNMLQNLMQTHLGFSINPATTAAAVSGARGSGAVAVVAGGSSAAGAGTGAGAAAGGGGVGSGQGQQGQGRKGNKKGTLLFTSGGVARRY